MEPERHGTLRPCPGLCRGVAFAFALPTAGRELQAIVICSLLLRFVVLVPLIC